MYLYILLPFPDERKTHNLEIAMRAALCISLYSTESTEHFAQNLVWKLWHSWLPAIGNDDDNDMADARTCEMGHQQPQMTNLLNLIFYKPATPRQVHNSRHLSLFWATSIQSTAFRPIVKVILILSFHLRLRLLSGLLPSYFPHRNHVCISCVPHTLPISTSLIFRRNNIWW